MFFLCQTHTKNRSRKKKKTIRHRQLFKAIESFLAPTPVLLLVIVIENRLKVKYELRRNRYQNKNGKEPRSMERIQVLKAYFFGN